MDGEERDYAGEIIEILNDTKRGRYWHAWATRRQTQKALEQIGPEYWETDDIETLAARVEAIMSQDPAIIPRWSKARRC